MIDAKTIELVARVLNIPNWNRPGARAVKFSGPGCASVEGAYPDPIEQGRIFVLLNHTPSGRA